jgi:hypothetical protein
VLVGLLLPVGGRVQANFPANTRLWDVLLQFEQQGEGKLNLTKRVAAGTGDKKRKADEPAEGCYMLPALTYMQREVCTRALLASAAVACKLGRYSCVCVDCVRTPGGDSGRPVQKHASRPRA